MKPRLASPKVNTRYFYAIVELLESGPKKDAIKHARSRLQRRLDPRAARMTIA
jgi:hypothetical protein